VQSLPSADLRRRSDAPAIAGRSLNNARMVDMKGRRDVSEEIAATRSTACRLNTEPNFIDLQRGHVAGKMSTSVLIAFGSLPFAKERE
jgi:hypothetical protein